MFYEILFYNVYCNENRLKNNMTPYESRNEKTCLGTDHLMFLGGGEGEGYLGPSVYEPRHDKTNKMAVCPAKTQISLGIRPV